MFDGNVPQPDRRRGQARSATASSKAGITADMITAVGIVMAVGARSPSVPAPCSLGLLLLVLTGIPDLLDGAVAKASGKSTRSGVRSSTRCPTGSPTGCCSAASPGTCRPAASPPGWSCCPVAGYVTASLVSYIRAKADALGFDARGGLVERAERFILLAFGLLFAAGADPGAGPDLVLNLITAGQRFVKVWRQATAQTPALSDRRRRRRPRRARPGRVGPSARRGPRPAAASRTVAPEPRHLTRRRWSCSVTGLRAASGPGPPRPPPRRLRRSTRAAQPGLRPGSPPEQRLMVERNLRRVYGDGPRRVPPCAATCSAVFDTYARYWLDSFRLPTWRPTQIDRGFSDDGHRAPSIAAARTAASAPILALPHLGGWEWAAALAHQGAGLGGRRGGRAARAAGALRVVPRLPRRPRHAHHPARARRAGGRGRRSAGRGRDRVPAVRPGHLPAPASRSSSSASAPACPAGPAVMALRSGVAAAADRGRTSRATTATRVVLPPLDTERRGKLRADVTRVTQDLAHALEVLIRRAPEQWHLLQPNWPSDYDALGRHPPELTDDPDRAGDRRRGHGTTSLAVVRIGLVCPYSLSIPGWCPGPGAGAGPVTAPPGPRDQGARAVRRPAARAVRHPARQQRPDGRPTARSPRSPPTCRPSSGRSGPSGTRASTWCTSTSRWCRARPSPRCC